MAEFKGGEGDLMRLRMLEKQRQQQLEELKQKKKQVKEKVAVSVMDINSKFAAKSDFGEEQLKAQTFGLVTHEDFVRRQSELNESEKEVMEFASRKKKRKERAEKSKLTFEEDEEEEEIIITKKRIKKNPSVDTSFLPDKDREAWESAERERLKNEWIEQQEALKKQEIPVTYSYWDGIGHRKTLNVLMGTPIDRFLEMVRQEWKELRGVSVSDLLFVKEDMILPHDISFYDLVVMKARGKSGPLFNWDVHEDIRLVNDASKEKDESHAAKVVERRWYERNKHIFPASRWEVFDPTKQREEKYTIRDSLTKH